MVVAPGFIDMLGQSELTILVDPRLPSKIYQGITTEITGEGGSIAPLNDAIIKADKTELRSLLHITPDWRTFRQYFARLEKQGMGINLASYVGATQVRRMVLGDDDVQPTPAQLEQMGNWCARRCRTAPSASPLRSNMRPRLTPRPKRLIALAAEASKFGGIYATHMRNEGDAVLPAIDEALRIGREAHIPVEIWHLKVAGKANWGRMPEVVAKINAARAQGMDVTADTYAYPAWFNEFLGLHSALGARWRRRQADRAPEGSRHARPHPQRHADALERLGQRVAGNPGPEAILIGVVQNPKLLPLQGKTLAEVAKLWNKDPMDALFDLLIEDNASTESCGLRHVGAGRGAGAAAALGLGGQRFVRHVTGRNAGPGASAPARLRHVSAHPAQICSRRKEAHAGRCDPQVLGAAGAAHAPDRPRRAESRACGPTSWSSIPRRSATWPPSKIPTSYRKGWSTCW